MKRLPNDRKSSNQWGPSPAYDERRQRLDAIGFVWDTFEDDWEEGFAALRKFKAREGHCRVSQQHLEGTCKLGQWVAVQRRFKDIMPAERRQRLDAIGFVWDPHTTHWEERFAALKRFKAREAHCRVPSSHKEGAFNLGKWVGVQRASRDTMPAERRQRLETIGFVWRPFAEDWEEGFAALKKFKAREGHCRVPHPHIEGSFRLGGWVNKQREDKDTMPVGRRQRLDAIGFVWDPFEDDWEEGFAALRKFKAREGHCRVPSSHKEGTFRLGFWVSNQRTHRGTMPAKRRQRLESTGLEWNSRTAAWEDGFAALKKFKAREGHCRVPHPHVEGTFWLGGWVNKQRADRDTMPDERRQRLESIGFVWAAHTEDWEEGFAALKKFKARERHCRVSQQHLEGTFKLGQWVSSSANTKRNANR